MHRRALLQLGLVSTAAPTLALAATRAVEANAHGAVGDGKTLNTQAIRPRSTRRPRPALRSPSSPAST